jgi:hypothetical protein
MKKKLKLLSLFTLLTIGVVFIAEGQPCPPGGCDDEDPSEETSIPFDGGASLLLAAGLGIGGKKLYENFKNKK